MAKMKPQYHPNLFETNEPLPAAESKPSTTSSQRSEQESAKAATQRVDPNACPRCGGRSQLSVRPAEMGGTRYCPVCQGEDGCYYFTPAPTNAVTVSDPVAPSEPEQVPLIETGEKWEEHWRGMPEFKQEDQMPYKTVYVHFAKREDMAKFAKLIGQKVDLTTKFVWYPRAEVLSAENKRWVDKP